MTAEIRLNYVSKVDVKGIPQQMAENGGTCHRQSPPFGSFSVVIGERPAHPLTTVAVPASLVDRLGSRLAHVAGAAHVTKGKDKEDASH